MVAIKAWKRELLRAWVVGEMCDGFSSQQIPARMWAGIERYVLHGVRPGEFLRAVISNDLCEATGKADDENLPLLRNYVLFFYNFTPADCWHSKERMVAWLKAGGWDGSHPIEEEACQERS